MSWVSSLLEGEHLEFSGQSKAAHSGMAAREDDGGTPLSRIIVIVWRQDPL